MATRRRVNALLFAIMVLLFLLLTAIDVARAQSKLTPEGSRLIVDHEVGGRRAYEKRYSWPVCPACDKTASGVTIGIGYDLRHQTVPSIRTDWGAHPHLSRLIAAQGLGGQRAIAMTRTMRDVITPFPYAMDIFNSRGIVPYAQLTSRVFGPDAAKLSPWAQDALRSLVYNRGGSMVGRSRIEMRFIRDTCTKLWRSPEAANACIARQLRVMVRIWEGGAIEGGMRRRRNDEANLAQFARYPM